MKTVNSVLPSTAASFLAVTIACCGANAEGPKERPAAPGATSVRFEWNPLNKTIADLAKAQGLRSEDFRTYYCRPGPFPGGFGYFSSNTAMNSLTVGEVQFAVAVQTVEPISIPGVSAQQLVLISPEGKILDRVQCDMNSRYGVVETDVLSKPASDGARLVMRFVGRQWSPGGPRTKSHNWHTIAFRGKFWTFGAAAGEDNNAHGQWNEKGLCRIGIANDKFVVLFPNLQMPEIKKAKALRITYYVRGAGNAPLALKQLDIVDPKQVSELLAGISIAGEDVQLGGVGPDPYTTIEFVMPDGTKSPWRLLARDVLWCIMEPDRTPIPGAGRIYLTSRAFFDGVSKAVSKAEGQPIDLLKEKK